MNTFNPIPIICTFLCLGCILCSCDLDRIDDEGPFVCGQIFLDPRDGKTYRTIWIADDGSHDLNKPGKCWMTENLEFNTSNFGTSCYATQPAKCDTFGRLYSSFVLSNVCMNGWHIATAEEWSDLYTTYGWTELITGNGPIYQGDSATFLPGGLSKLDLLMGGSCSSLEECDGSGQNVSFWATDSESFSFFNRGGNSSVWSTAVIFGATDPRFYVRCVQNP